MIYDFDTENGRILQLDAEDGSGLKAGLFCGGYKSNGDWHEPELMQYTGLNYHNGDEIYEGDIVKTKIWSNVPGVQKEFRYIGQVVFHQGGFYLKGTRNWNLHMILLSSARLHCAKCLGNIYEHPELLNPSLPPIS